MDSRGELGDHDRDDGLCLSRRRVKIDVYVGRRSGDRFFNVHSSGHAALHLHASEYEKPSVSDVIYDDGFSVRCHLFGRYLVDAIITICSERGRTRWGPAPYAYFIVFSQKGAGLQNSLCYNG